MSAIRVRHKTSARGATPVRQPVRSEQLAFDLPCRAALDAQDFLVSPSNEEAVDAIDRWPDWPHWAMLIAGPARSGKSHLANVWRANSHASVCSASVLDMGVAAKAVAARNIVIEDIDRGIGNEQAFFHLLNLAREHQLSVLITSAVAPGDLAITLPDLKSRLCALPLVQIHEPDDNLLRGVLVKHFNDRQLQVAPAVIDYLVLCMEHSMAAAARVVAEIDRKTLASRRKVSQRLAMEVLIALSQNDAEEAD